LSVESALRAKLFISCNQYERDSTGRLCTIKALAKRLQCLDQVYLLSVQNGQRLERSEEN
jgi:hypothetical protein